VLTLAEGQGTFEDKYVGPALFLEHF